MFIRIFLILLCHFVWDLKLDEVLYRMGDLEGVSLEEGPLAHSGWQHYLCCRLRSRLFKYLIEHSKYF